MFQPKVAMPTAQLPQMKSVSQQAPFYFGGSQVPSAIIGSGIKNPTAILLKNIRK